MFKIKKRFKFEAGHQLVHHDGKCKNRHGHSYLLTLHLKGETVVKEGPKKNMLIDFSDISIIVKPMIKKYLDHHWLNETLNTDSPTAEFIAKWIYDHLKPDLALLYAVTVEETTTCEATYAP